MTKPLSVGVCITVATDAKDANAQAKRKPAYKKLLAKYPSDKFDRRYVGTSYHKQGGFWMVEFEVRGKTLG